MHIWSGHVGGILQGFCSLWINVSNDQESGVPFVQNYTMRTQPAPRESLQGPLDQQCLCFYLSVSKERRGKNLRLWYDIGKQLLHE